MVRPYSPGFAVCVWIAAVEEDDLLQRQRATGSVLRARSSGYVPTGGAVAPASGHGRRPSLGAEAAEDLAQRLIERENGPDAAAYCARLLARARGEGGCPMLRASFAPKGSASKKSLYAVETRPA